MYKTGLPPIADKRTRLFILGSLPGDRSLEVGRYYAHPTNQFWKLLGPIIGADLHRLAYDERLALLQKNAIGLWDVISAARREGSADHKIRDASHNAIAGLKSDYPNLVAIGFNGGRAAKDGYRLLSAVSDVTLLSLPSSSGMARISFAEKAAIWAQLRRFVGS